MYQKKLCRTCSICIFNELQCNIDDIEKFFLFLWPILCEFSDTPYLWLCGEKSPVNDAFLVDFLFLNELGNLRKSVVLLVDEDPSMQFSVHC